ncbi:hypothetical protein J3A83DRAFT_4189287 [Scleroderma citrinum]
MWRHFLNTIDPSQLSSTKSASSKLVVLDILGENIVQVAAKGLAEAWEEIVWQGMQVQVSSLSDPPLWLVCSILWEPYELNFHYELYMLDCAIVPEHWTTSEAWTQQTLLHSIFPGSMEVALPYVNNFCELLSAWPGAPSHLQSSAKMDGQDNTCQFYLQTAFDFLG